MLSHPSHRVLLGLVLFLLATFICQLFSSDGLEAYFMVPHAVEQSWESLRGGSATISDFSSLTTLLTGALLHASWEHLIYNLLFLWIFAGLVGELVGIRWMIALFLVTAICGSMGDLLLRSGSESPSLGASGAVMGFEGAYLGLAVRWAVPNPHIWPISHPIAPLRLMILALVGFGLDVTGAMSGQTGTAYGAHLGGFLSGLFLTSFVIGRPKGLTPPSQRRFS